MADNSKINSYGRRRRTNLSDEFKEDRLSLLPDDILIQIFSHLPFYVAVDSSLLSRRWRYLWKSITNFQFQTLDMNFQTVNKILHHLISPKIRVVDYSYGNDDDEDDDSEPSQSEFQAAESCFLYILRRNVEVLKVRSSSSYLPVPNFVFNCETLVVLELDGKLNLKLELDWENDLPVNGTSINLPNLEKLRLRIDHYEYCLVRTLLKLCPKLEDLCLILDLTDGDLLEIFAPNLKSLSIDNLVITPYNDVVIDAPKLAKLKICDRCSYFSFRTIPTLLVEASINFRSYDDSECDILYLYVEDHDWTEEGYARAISKFFRGMSSVRSFKLQCFANMHMFLGSSDDGDMAVFHNLTFFKAKLDNDVGWEDLLCSLHCFPNIEHLELNLDEFYFGDPMRCFAPIVLPDCLLTKLKRVTLKKIKGTGVEIKLMELILNHADVLEELFLYAPTGPCMEYEATQLWKEYKFCEALFNLSRSFITCKIVFSGVYINASSNAFEKGLIGCQLRFSEDLAGIDID